MSPLHPWRGKEGEKGTTLIEFSLVFAFLMMIALGAYEYGMAFRDWLSVTVATREGGRVAASAANHGDADCVILEAATGALQGFDTGEVEFVHIYKSDINGSYPGSNSYTRIYRPSTPADLDLVVCQGSTWFATNLGSNWDPEDRVNDTGTADWIGVRVEFEHQWQTNFLWWNGVVNWDDDAVFRMEPPAP
ncbi:MAG TPA: TadE/TadG family type IV pilus assembly protein [Acidimicrobiia bacterium]|nr:TadE/TadG family type IV pilus assembly protein [Acidimicrobiia bacterium]